MIFLVLAAFAWRIQGIDRQSLWRDEVDAVYFALRDLPNTLAMFTGQAQNGALFFLALRPWLRLAGSSELALRLPAAFFSVMAVPLLWQVARKLIPAPGLPLAGSKDGLNDKPAVVACLVTGWQALMARSPWLATLLLVVNPYHLWYGQDGKMYALTTLLALLATWFFFRGIDGGGWRPWLGFFITTSLAIYSHLLMVLLLPLYFFWFLIAWPQSKAHQAGYFSALAGLTLPYLPLLGWQWDMLTAAEKQTAMVFSPLSEVVGSVLLYQTHSILPPGDPIWRVPLIALGIGAAVLGFRVIAPRPGGPLPYLSAIRRHLILLSWLVLPVASIYLLSLFQPVFAPRYVIWVMPAFIMLLALGIQLLWQEQERPARLLASALLIYVVVFWGYLGWQQKTRDIKADLRGAVRYVYDRRSPDELLVLQIPHLEVAYRYYSSDQGSYPLAGGEERLGRWAGGLGVFDPPGEETGQEVDLLMRLMLGDALTGDIWYIASEAELVDPYLQMEAWFDQNLSLVDAADFYQVQVRHYQATTKNNSRD